MAAIIITNPAQVAQVAQSAQATLDAWPTCQTCGQLRDVCPGVHWQDFDWEDWELDDTLSADRYDPLV